MYWGPAERPDCTPDYAAALSLAAMTVSLTGSIIASRCNATAITQPNASQLTDNTQRAEPHGTPSPAIVQQRFLLAADLQVDFDPKQMKDNGSVAKITPPWTHGKIRRPLRGVESAVLSLSAPS